MKKAAERVPIPKAAVDQCRQMKDLRPRTELEEAFIAGLAMALEVPKGWVFDDSTFEFVKPKK